MTFTDALQRIITIPSTPQRIISLCPSVTETLFDLGLGEKVVGRTRFCIHPKEELKKVMSVGGTKEVKYERFHALQPDIIFAVKEENTQEMIKTLEKDFAVYVFDVETIKHALEMISVLGEITGTSIKAAQLRKAIEDGWKDISDIFPPLRTTYFIWKDPYMLAGKNTFIHEVMEHIGLQNLALPLEGRYPTITEIQLSSLNPELILLSSEPYPFQKNHVEYFQNQFPNSKVEIVDGEYFSWYGSRMYKAIDYFKKMGFPSS